MSKVAFLFPGKGSQEVGMGKDLIVNYNSPYQIVVSGESNTIKELLILGEEEEEINIVPLKVSVPFHSSLISKAKKFSQLYVKCKHTRPINTSNL